MTMTDRERLTKLVEESFADQHDRRRMIVVPDTVNHLLANGVIFATDNTVGGKWISVTERLPESFKTVLVYDSTGKRIEAAYMTRHKEWVGVVINHNITHWMPLPESPREGE